MRRPSRLLKAIIRAGSTSMMKIRLIGMMATSSKPSPFGLAREMMK